MANFVIRFDFRSPAFGTPMADLYAAALDMAVFAEQHAFNTVSISERHCSEDGYLPSPIILSQVRDERVGQAYQDERARLGLAPGFVSVPPVPPQNVFVSEDPEATWAQIGEHLLHDSRSYAAWHIEAGQQSAALGCGDSIDALRRGSMYAVLTPDECVDLLRRRPSLCVHPLCGGLPPEIGWETLHLIATKVLQPALA